MKVLIGSLVMAVILDYFIGDPKGWPHPVIYIGKWIKIVERWLRKRRLDTKFGGLLLWLSINGMVLFVGTGILFLVGDGLIEKIIILYGLFAALAATSLKREVMQIVYALKSGDLEAGRKYLSYVVGRDTSHLSQIEVIQGAIETTAESTIDGVHAPLLFIAIGSLIGCPLQMVWLYKTINTLDSMVGYIQVPYDKIGFVSAKIDDIFNFLPARIGSLMMLIAGSILGLDGQQGLRIWWRDRKKHRSPNAGHPESAVAGLLGIQLGGSHTYFGEKLEKPTIGDPRRLVAIEDIEQTIKIMYGSEVILLGTVIMGLWLLLGR